jgi:molybdopterin molybdotransferase
VTGDEVLGAAEAVADWQLRDSNGPALRAMLGAKAWVELLPARRCPDEPALLRELVGLMLASADLLLLTGGVSMGDRDFVPGVLRDAGAEVLFHKVPQRPGKPVLGAIGPEGQAILGLPGNPLSVMVTARRMASPIARRLAGSVAFPPPIRVEVNDDGKRIELWWHRLVRLVDASRAELVESRGSGDIPSAARSHGFVEIPPGEGGGSRDFYPWTI